MWQTVQITTPCRQGRLVITNETVSLVSQRWLRGRARWSVARENVAGASVLREPGVVGLAICTTDGVIHCVDPLLPGDALRVVAELGYAGGGSPALSASAEPRHVIRMACAGGRAELGADGLSYHPRLPWRQARAWTLPLDQIAGASSSTRPGVRMLHDLAIHTTDGRVFALCRLRPDHALALARLFGHLYAALPTEPTSQREAIEYHITTKPQTLLPPASIEIEPSRRQAKQRKLERELDDFWKQQRGATNGYHPLPGV